MVKYDYDAWGNCLVTGDSSLAIANPFMYRGYYYDFLTGLYYLQTRYYDPKTGRFISPDNIDYADPETADGLNLYVYCLNNPVMYVDPTGHGVLEWLFAGLIVAASAAMACFTAGTSLMASAIFTGAAIGGGFSLVSQGINCAVNGGDFSWGQFALDLGVGAISLAVGASGVSMLGATVIGALVGGGSDVVSQLISGKSFSQIDWTSVLVNTAIGGVAGYFGGAGAKNIKGLSQSIFKGANSNFTQAIITFAKGKSGFIMAASIKALSKAIGAYIGGLIGSCVVDIIDYHINN